MLEGFEASAELFNFLEVEGWASLAVASASGFEERFFDSLAAFFSALALARLKFKGNELESCQNTRIKHNFHHTLSRCSIEAFVANWNIDGFQIKNTLVGQPSFQ